MDRDLVLLVDMDGKLTKLAEKVVARYNERFEDTATVADVVTWQFAEIPRFRAKGLTDEILNSWFLEPGFFRDLEPIPGGKEAVKLFHDEGHEIIIATSLSGPECAKDKMLWLKEHLPFLTKNDVCMGHKKWKLKGDILIDDSAYNILNYKQAWPEAKTAAIEYPYNKTLAGSVSLLAKDYTKYWEAWMRIAEFVAEVSEGKA